MQSSEAFRDHSKKKSFLYKERNEAQRQEFLKRLKDIHPSRLVWVDECGVEEHLMRLYARSPRGQRVYAERSGKKTHNRLTVIAAYVQKKAYCSFPL